MNMRVDVVAAPLRYRRLPLLVLLFIAVVPAVGLLVAHRWLDAEADRYEASRDQIELLAGTISAAPGAAVDAAGDPDADLGPSGADDPGDAPDDPGTDPIDADLGPADDIDPRLAERRAQLATSLLDYRRLPGPVVDLANAELLGEAVTATFGFLNEHSCVAVSVDGRTAAVFNESSPVIPASTQKLVVAAVALDVLGSDYTFETTVRAPIASDGVVEGDVYLVGGGDPLLTADDYPIEDDRYPAFATTSLDVLADAFVANGIERINGTVIGDGDRYDDEYAVDGWGPGVAFDSAGPYDALIVNDSRVLGRGQEDDPVRAAARELVRLLGNRNVRVDDGWGRGQASTTSRVIGSVESAPLSEIVAEMLTNSDNNTAEMLVKELGYVDAGDGSRVAGLNVIDRTLRTWGMPMDGVRVLDGSGLHLDNRSTCALLLAVLQRLRGTPAATGLPSAGQSGTLSDEFADSDLVGRLFAKTGTLGNPPADEPPLASKALAGYVTTDTGNTIEFALVINDAEISTEAYRALWDAVGERLLSYPAGPDPAELGPLAREGSS